MGTLPSVFIRIDVTYFLLRQVVGVRVEGNGRTRRVQKLAKGELLRVNIASLSTSELVNEGKQEESVRFKLPRYGCKGQRGTITLRQSGVLRTGREDRSVTTRRESLASHRLGHDHTRHASRNAAELTDCLFVLCDFSTLSVFFSHFPSALH